MHVSAYYICMYVCIYEYLFIYVCMCICMLSTYVCICVCVCLYMHICTYVSSYVCVCMYACICKYVCMYYVFPKKIKHIVQNHCDSKLWLSCNRLIGVLDGFMSHDNTDLSVLLLSEVKLRYL
jgi:hypothetical protein